jgi:hypothetical protein
MVWSDGGFCEHADETSGFIRDREFIDMRSDFLEDSQEELCNMDFRSRSSWIKMGEGFSKWRVLSSGI